MKKLALILSLLALTIHLSAQEVVLFSEGGCQQIPEQLDQAPQFISKDCKEGGKFARSEDCADVALLISLRNGFEMKKSRAKVPQFVKLELRLLVDQSGQLAGVMFSDSYDAKIKEEVLERLKRGDINTFHPAKAGGRAVCGWTKPLELHYGEYGFNSEIFQVVQSMPLFPGCEKVRNAEKRKKCARKEMEKYIYDRLEYPKDAKKKKIEGIVVVRLIIDHKGHPVYPVILRDIGGGCGEAALKALADMPQWTPGKQAGVDVNVFYNIPVRFKL